MSVVSNVVKKRKKTESKPQSQLNKCLNEKRRREQENIYIEELAELISASTSDMSSLSVKPDKCAILQETVNQIRLDKQRKPEQSDDLQQSEVSSSKPTILTNDVYGPLLLEALEGFLFVVNVNGKVEFVSENITSFLKYTQEEIADTIIYNIIHTNDRARFSSNLLPMMSLGNGNRSWSTETNSGSSSKSRSFNCRFLIKSSEEQDGNMDNKQISPNSQYENMQVSAVCFPYTTDVNEIDGVNEQQNRLACVARRIPANEKSPTSLGVEQFTTRMDRTGKVMDIDTSGVSSTYSHYLNKELVGCVIQDLCHPSDSSKLKQHLKETLETGSNTSVVYKFQVTRDRYVRVQTKSKRFNSHQSATEHVIVSTHSIIRDADSPVPPAIEGNQRNVPSPSLASASSNSGNMPVTASVNGSVNLTSLSLPTSYGNFQSLSPNDPEYGLNDLVLEMFPGSNWNLDQNSSQSKDSDSLTATSYIASSPQAGASSRTSDMGSGMHLTNSAFSPSLMSSRSGSSNPSPSLPGRSPTPYGGSISCFSPSAQPIGGKTSPPCALPAKADSLNSSSADVPSANSLRQERQYNMKGNQKLRNLLTQNIEDINNRSNLKQSSQDEVIIVNESRNFDGPQARHRQNARENSTLQVPCSSSNVILRDLLNQDDEDSDFEVPVEPIDRPPVAQVPNSFVNSVSCKATESSQQRVGNNNMLRKLLNNDDVDRNYRKSQDLIHQLLIAGPSDKGASFQNDRYKSDSRTSHHRIPDNLVPKQVHVNASHANPDVTYLSETTATKRKQVEKYSTSNAPSKRQNNSANLHAQLAGQNPMLVSMLEQTPRTPPSVPTSVANSIMTQLPQERLPKNLEKKLVHTPYTAAAANCTTTTTQAFSNSLQTSASVQQDVVTSDTRGHILQQQIGIQSGLNKATYSQPQQYFLDKILSGADENLLLARSLALGLSSASTTMQNAPVFVQQLAQSTASDISGSATLADILSDAGLADAESLSDSIQTTHASDPGFAEILEQIYSLQEDLNVETPHRDDRGTILKIIADSEVAPQVNIVSRPLTNPTNTVHDISEKIAISAIQKQLMSFEGSSLSITSRTGSVQNSTVVPTYSQAGRPSTQVSGTPVTQTQQSPEITILQPQQQVSAASLPPNYNSSLVASRVRLPVTAPAYVQNSQDNIVASVQRQQRVQLVRNTYIGLGGLSGIGGPNANQIRKSIIERKQRLYLQQQQKRLLEQQQKQQLTMQTQQPLDVISSSGSASFPENMTDLLNIVAPNVTLQRSSDLQVPDPQSSPHFNTNLSNPLPSPVSHTSTTPQLSPGQRHNTQSPFSPLSQQQFQSQTSPPATYQQARVSPHPPPSYPQGRSSHSPSPIPPTGPRSPHLVLSPQQVSVASPQWSQQRPTSSQVANNLQLQNPMLNAQLSQQASLAGTQIRLTAQQRQQLAAMRSLPSPNSMQNSRNSPFASQSDGNYPPLSPIAVLQNQPQTQQQRIQRTISGPGRITTNTQGQSGNGNYATNEPVLSPQPLQSPSYSQSLPTSTVSSFVTLPSQGIPTTYSLSQGGQHFNFDRQNIQVFTSSASDSLRSVNNVQASSDYVRQELRAVVGARNQQTMSPQNQVQQPLHSVSLSTSSASAGSVSRSLNVHSLSRETLEELGLELLQGNDIQQSPQQILYSQALLGANSIECSNQPGVSSPRVEEPKPADQKKSLLQQLLSEPT